jgi:ABC-type dipeptide/oligopeptide/nickel transport system permease component
MIARRLGWTVLVLLGLSFVTFVILHVLPGDPARTAAGPNATAAQIAVQQRRLGLNQPLLTQYVHYLGNILRGRFGTSIVTHQPISHDLSRALPASIELVLAALFLNVIVAIPLGALAAVRKNTWVDALNRTGVITLGAIPIFWLGLILQLLIGGRLHLLPLSGEVALNLDTGHRITGLLTVDTFLEGHWAACWSSITHLILPAVTLAASFVPVVARTVRSSMVAVMDQEYITMARAKGASELRVVIRHGLKNALVPSVTIIGMQAGWMLSSTVLVETIYGLPGIGAYAVNAVIQSDLPAVVAVVLVIGTVFVAVNAFVDILYVILNPQVRAEAIGAAA